jgi:hypothetical protein
MKQIFTLLTFVVLLGSNSRSQVVLNEIYTDPGSGKHEFFELYNTNPTGTISVDNFTIITFFDISGSKGFYVMDLPNMSIASRGYFVGSAALPFNYQTVVNSTASDFNWNSVALTANNGSLKKWVKGTTNLFDGNANYDASLLPLNFNDFFYRRTGTGASYTVFVYNNGQLINTFIGGTGGNATIITEIVNMPSLFVDMAGGSTDFTINFSGYASLPLEYCIQDAGSDNGYIREFDGACNYWVKSSSGVQHTPQASNGALTTSNNGTVNVAAAIARGNAVTGSLITYDAVAGPTSAFPLQLQVFTDLGTTNGSLDGSDVFVAANTENVVSDGAFYTTFFPYNAHILIAVKTNAGCIDRILWIPNAIVLGVKLISFEGEMKNGFVQLDWQVGENETATRFEVQKSINGGDFVTISSITATSKKGDEKYTFSTPANTDSRVSYRLATFGKSGKVDYSKTIVFTPSGTQSRRIVLLNNPVTESLSISYASTAAGYIEVSVVDMKGSVVKKEKLNSIKGNNIFQVSLPASLQKGLYVVDLFDGKEHINTKFIRQ